MEFAIDTVRSPLLATGVVRPVEKFGERGVQEQDGAGTPLWEVEVLVQAREFGKPVTKTLAVRLPAPHEPQVAQFQPIGLEHPVVSFYVAKGGVLRTNLSAAGLASVNGKAARAASSGEAAA